MDSWKKLYACIHMAPIKKLICEHYLIHKQNKNKD